VIFLEVAGGAGTWAIAIAARRDRVPHHISRTGHRRNRQERRTFCFLRVGVVQLRPVRSHRKRPFAPVLISLQRTSSAFPLARFTSSKSQRHIRSLLYGRWRSRRRGAGTAGPARGSADDGVRAARQVGGRRSGIGCRGRRGTDRAEPLPMLQPRRGPRLQQVDPVCWPVCSDCKRLELPLPRALFRDLRNLAFSFRPETGMEMSALPESPLTLMLPGDEHPRHHRAGPIRPVTWGLACRLRQRLGVGATLLDGTLHDGEGPRRPPQREGRRTGKTSGTNPLPLAPNPTLAGLRGRCYYCAEYYPLSSSPSAGKLDEGAS